VSIEMGNNQPVFNRLEVPSFDLSWLCIDDVTGEAVVLIPGGGGSTKSGVKNMIQIGRLADGKGPGFEMTKSFETDVRGKSVLCSGVAVGACMGHNIVCAFFENYCSIMKVSKDEDDHLELNRVVDFRADFSKGGSVNCACVLPSGHIVTGGDDGVCRLWAVGYNKNKSKDWQVKPLSQMEGHTGPIMAISYHPNDALVIYSNLCI
jgi:WD domain, G-beta repeat